MVPFFKKKAIFFIESIDQYRPEASRLRRIFSSFKANKKKIVLFPDTQVCPFYSSQEYHKLSMKKFTYSNSKDYPTFVSSLEKFLSCNFFDDVIIVADDFLQGIVRDMQI